MRQNIHAAQPETVATQQASGSIVQAKLELGRPGDAFEQEADAIVQRVMTAPAQNFVQNKCAACAEEEHLQAKEGGGGGSGTAGVVPAPIANAISAANGSGASLDHPARSFMEQRLGHDLSEVTIHNDAAAGALSRQLGAKAFTTGKDIYFAEGQYQPHSSQGRQLLAHELVHVLQQGHGRQRVQRYTTQDCSEEQRNAFAVAYQRAKALINNAIARLTANPVTAATQRIFANHFGGYGPWRRDVVVGQLRETLAILNHSDYNYQCETECDGELAYTYWIFGDIHLCPSYFRSDLNEQANTLIHEIHHADPARGHFDLGYHGPNGKPDTYWIIAVNNADAYSVMCQSLYENP